MYWDGLGAVIVTMIGVVCLLLVTMGMMIGYLLF